MTESFDIDFVIPWVDGRDQNWITDFNKYCSQAMQKNIDSSGERYRDYGLLKYWFRGVEKFAPYVRKIHFITNGQKPDWLNLNNEKLHWVKHEDYIPSEYLPVFSSHPIEIYMHKIEDLAEHFVYFNDDLFLTNTTDSEFFFHKGLPCDYAIANIQGINRTVMRGIVINDLIEVNKRFKKKACIKNNFFQMV